MKVVTGVAVLVSVVLVAAGVSAAHPQSSSLRQRMATVARRLAQSLDDSRPAKTARVYGPASYRVALHAFSGGTTPNRRKGRFYVIVVRGRFVCAWCPRPPGAESPQGSIATKLWSPTGHGGGFGLNRKVPGSLSLLGPPIRISLR
jgi:hypothetical protein